MAISTVERPSIFQNLQYWLLLGIAFALQTGHAISVFSISRAKITGYEFSLLLVIMIGAIALCPYQLTRPAFSYVSWLCILVATMFIIGLPTIPFIRLIAHGLAAGAALISVFLFINMRTSTIIYAFWLTSLPVLLADIAAFLGFIPTNSASQVIPFTPYGGIGISTGFGTHGLILNTAIICGIGLLWTVDLSQKKTVLIKFSCLSMVAMQILSQSRSSLLALSLGLGTLLFFYVFQSEYQVVAKIGMIAGSFLTLIGGGFVVATTRRRTLVQRLDQITTAVEVTLANPITGIGWDVFYPAYSAHVIHFTPANYFVAGGVLLGAVYLLTLTYPLFILGRQITHMAENDFTILLAALYIAVVVETFFFKSTPSAHVFTYGALLTSSATQEVAGCE